MLTQPQLQRFAHESGIRNLEIVEKEVVLTYFLQLLSERGFLADMAFKGGTCIRKTWLGPSGRFSTDVDFTATAQDRSADDCVLQLAEITTEPFHGVQFEIDMGDKGWYEADDGVSWGVLPNYRHDLSNGVLKLQVSNRETPTLPLDSRRQPEISYFKHLPFKPADLPCLCIEEILAEKIRATYQRNKPRDIWALDHFAKPHMSLSPALKRKTKSAPHRRSALDALRATGIVGMFAGAPGLASSRRRLLKDETIAMPFCGCNRYCLRNRRMSSSRIVFASPTIRRSKRRTKSIPANSAKRIIMSSSPLTWSGSLRKSLPS